MYLQTDCILIFFYIDSHYNQQIPFKFLSVSKLLLVAYPDLLLRNKLKEFVHSFINLKTFKLI